MLILLIFSFLAGLVTVLSPCVLPILPILLSVGVGQGKLRPLGIILGLIASFSFFTLALTALVHATGVSPDLLRYIAIALIIFFGITMLFPKFGDYSAAHLSGITRLGTFLQEKSAIAGAGFVSGLIMGIALGLLWTPCAGPILASITTLVATSAITWQAVVMTLAYSTGAALPMFLISYGSSKIISSTTILAKYAEIIRKIFGILMILGAFAIAFHFDVVLQQWAVKYFPMITIENNALVQKQLEGLSSVKPSTETIHAPEIVGIAQWINSEPLSLHQLRGKVVLIDFWTYSCINCIRTLPYLKRWYDAYKDKGFVLIGVHTPEFEFEKNSANVKAAVKRFGMTYPVALDSDYKTWQNYANRYWPAHYLVNQQGVIVHTHFGEGAYQETENEIRRLLGLTPLAEKVETITRARITPETYLGFARGRYNYHQPIVLKENQVATYNYSGELEQHQLGLKGQWFAAPEFIQAKEQSILDLRFVASRVYIVMESPTPQLVHVLLNNKPVPDTYRTRDMDAQGNIQVFAARMYDILDLKGDRGDYKLTLQVPRDVSCYVFTFGSAEQ